MGPMSDANSEECVPPPAKKTRANNAPPAMQYDRWPKPPSSTLPAQVQPPTQATLNRASVIQYARRPKPHSSTLHAQVQPPVPAPVPAVHEINVTSPFALQHALPGPSRADPAAQEHSDAASSTFIHALPGPSGATPPTQGQEVTLQHALSGPSGIQILPSDYTNVSIFSSNYLFLPLFSTQYKLISAGY